MTLLGQLAAFALGIWLSIRLIAAVYGILDLWYTIGTAYPRVVRGILAWGGAIVAVAWLLGPPFRAAFGSGLLAFGIFYVSIFWLRYPVLDALERRAKRP
jgi:hypothetical protein